MTGKKFDDGKPRYDLIPTAALEQLATVLTFGAKKYGANNWQSVPDAQNRYYSAMMRHVEADRGGEVFDEESGLPHLTHALACVTFMLHFALHKPVLLSTVAAEEDTSVVAGDELDELLDWLGPDNASRYMANMNADHLVSVAKLPKTEQIVRAFSWTRSNEDHAYWSSMNYKWLAHLREEKALDYVW